MSARHQAILAEECDIVVAADGDRRYDPEWLGKLLAQLARHLFGVRPADVLTLAPSI